MSKISLKPASSGTATFTIEAPATNTDRIFELPDEAGKVLTDVSDIEPQVKTATNASGAAPIYACRAWVNFDGTGTPSIRGSGNVSSITDNGAGSYTVNFTNALPDVNFSTCATSGFTAGSGGLFGVANFNRAADVTVAPTTTSVNVSTITPIDSRGVDNEYVNVAVFR